MSAAESTLDALIAARALIEDPANWTKGVMVFEVDGRMCYCTAGAVIEVDGWFSDALTALHAQLGGRVAMFNDDPDTTHADVLALFDRAIAAERAKAVSA